MSIGPLEPWFELLVRVAQKRKSKTFLLNTDHFVCCKQTDGTILCPTPGDCAAARECYNLLQGFSLVRQKA